MKMFVSKFVGRIAVTLAAILLFCVFRFDVAAFAFHKAESYLAENSRRSASPALIRDYLKTHTVRALEIGAGGTRRPGWLSTDIEPQEAQVFLDASEPFPLPDRSFRYVYSEQVIEHIPYSKGAVMLKESFRILEPGGKVRLATPNLEAFIRLLQADKTPEMQKYMQDKMRWHGWPSTPDPANYILNMQLREWGHQFVYTAKMMREALKTAGFHDIRQFQSGQSDDPALKGIEMRANSDVRDIDRYETMVFEGTRP